MLFLFVACEDDKPINQFPEIIEIAFSSETFEVGEEIRCLLQASDPEGKELVSSFSWEIEGNMTGEMETFSITSDNSNVGDTLTCTGTVTDPEGGSASSSVSTMIQNTRPEIQNVSISP